MSYAIVTKTHVDALITTARRWSHSTLVFELPPRVANELNLTDEAANQLGLTLLITNWNTAVLGGDPDDEGLDADDIAWMEQEYIDDGFAKPAGYTLDELPGEPAPESALKLIQSYRYQSNWEGEGLGVATAFVDALEAAARQQLGHAADDLEGLPRYSDTPWLPSDDDRDMFMTGTPDHTRCPRRRAKPPQSDQPNSLAGMMRWPEATLRSLRSVQRRHSYAADGACVTPRSE